MTPKSIRTIKDVLGVAMAKAFYTAEKDPENERARAYYRDLVEAERELMALPKEDAPPNNH